MIANEQLLNVSPSQLRRAAEIKDQIDALRAELSALIGGSSGSTPPAVSAVKPRRTMSPAARAKIAAAARARWARVKGSGGQATKSTESTTRRMGRRNMSAEGRARIAAAARARWARVRAAKSK